MNNHQKLLADRETKETSTLRPAQVQRLGAEDIAYLRAKFPRHPYDPNSTMSLIMYREGMQFMIDYIEREIVSKR